MQRMEFPLVLVFPVCFRTRNATSAGGIRFRFLFPVYFRFSLILFLLVSLFHLFFLHRSYRSARRGCILNLISERNLLEINLRNSDLIPYFGELPWVTPLLCLHYSMNFYLVNSFYENNFNFLRISFVCELARRRGGSYVSELISDTESALFA